MSRLLQLIAGQAHGGAEAFFERLALALQRAGEDAAAGHPPRSGARRAASRRWLEVVEPPFGGPLDLRTRPILSGAIAAFAPDVVLSWMSRATNACPEGDFIHVGPARRLLQPQILSALRSSDRQHARYRRLHPARGWPRDRVHYLPNFVADERAAPVPRRVFATPDEAPLALALGPAASATRAFDVLLDALAQVPRFHLWLAGEGRSARRWRRRRGSSASPIARHFPRLARRCRGAAGGGGYARVCSSRLEPLGNVVIEAWAAGMPVVAAASDGPRELIADGENGLLVPLERCRRARLRDARLAADPGSARELAEAGRDAYEAEFSEARVVALYREFLREGACADVRHRRPDDADGEAPAAAHRCRRWRMRCAIAGRTAPGIMLAPMSR